MTTKKYPVKAAYRTNLDSMRIYVLNRADEIRDGEYETITLMGKVMDDFDLINFAHELEDLIFAAYYPVDGKTYGRIKAISDERDVIRYATCIEKGMDEEKAAYAFLG